MNPYKVLGIDNSASDDEIKKAYRKLSKENHPDVNGGDDTRFKEINQAYKILTDPKERAHHEEQQFKRAGFSDPFGGFWSQSSMDEAFKNFYEGPFGPYKTNIKRKTHGTDIIVRLKITLEESFFGKPIEIKVDRSERLNTEKLVRRSRRIKVNIPRGAKNNQNLVLRGQGNQGINGGSDGDMVIQIGVKPHPHFIRKDHDLIAKVKVLFTSGILGGVIEFRNLDGEIVKAVIPENTQEDDVIEVVGKGMPVGNSDARGKLKLLVLYSFPKDINDKHRQLLKDMHEAYTDRSVISPERI